MATRKRALLGVGLWEQEVTPIAKSHGWPQWSIEYELNLESNWTFLFIYCVLVFRSIFTRVGTYARLNPDDSNQNGNRMQLPCAQTI